jgi:dihydrofolate reductase
MTIVSMIVATAHDNVIGKNNQMPWHLPADLAYFKRVTLGKPVIMGRKTFESIGRPLPGRQNIVISRDKHFHATGVDVVNSVEQALLTCGDTEEVMVIGGGSIYQHCLARADRLYITHIDAQLDGDTRFPMVDLVNDWQLFSEAHHDADQSTTFNLRFCVYQRVP